MSSQFDPESFLHASTTEAAQRRPPLPVGEYLGVITELKSRTWQGKKDPTQSGVAFDAKIDVDLTPYPEVMSAMGGAVKITLNDSIMVDVKEGTNTMDWGVGKNGQLRRYREALGMNVPGENFVPLNMIGRILKVKVSHRVYQDEIFDQVASVVKA